MKLQWLLHNLPVLRGNAWDICSPAQAMGREDSESTVPHPGSVPALPFGTDDWALVSVPASSVWLKLPKRVEWEIKYG